MIGKQNSAHGRQCQVAAPATDQCCLTLTVHHSRAFCLALKKYSIKYVIRKSLVIFFNLKHIDHYLVKFSTAMHTQIPTSDLVKYNILSKS